MKLTTARRRGLEVLAHFHPATVRYSNETSLSAGGYVYWQSANWLVDNGLAHYPSGSTMLALTDKGVELAREEGLLECEGHPAGPGDPMGETVYCDGTCRTSVRMGRAEA